MLRLFEAHIAELAGGVHVRRFLPNPRQRQIGPFVFLDHLGPVHFAPGQGLDVPPHPHIGLATCTYLFEGRLVHRDSLGATQEIAPGAVNWMTAGRGAVHSERTPDDIRRHAHSLHGLQWWVALPAADAERPPRFQHHAVNALPVFDRAGVQVRVLAGSACGLTSPLRTDSPLLLLDILLATGAALELPPPRAEEALALYLLAGEAVFDDGSAGTVGQGELAAVESRFSRLVARQPTRCMLFGGRDLGPRHVRHNFVATTRERIAQAEADWQAGRFPPLTGDPEYISTALRV